MTPEEKVAAALRYEIESATYGVSSARSVLSKALKALAEEQDVELSKPAADAVAKLTILTFFTEAIENEKSLAHIQLEKEYKQLEGKYKSLEATYQDRKQECYRREKLCSDIFEKKAELENLKKKCEEYEEIRKLKSTDARLYGARCAYEFAYQKTKDEKLALKSFNSYLIGNNESDKVTEEFVICESEEIPQKKVPEWFRR